MASALPPSADVPPTEPAVGVEETRLPPGVAPENNAVVGMRVPPSVAPEDANVVGNVVPVAAPAIGGDVRVIKRRPCTLEHGKNPAFYSQARKESISLNKEQTAKA